MTRNVAHARGEKNLDTVVERHFDWCRARRLSPKTLAARRTALRSLRAHATHPLLYLTHDDIQSWQQWLEARAVATTTLCGYLSHAAQFYDWAVDERLIDTTPMARIRPPKAPRYLPDPVDDVDVDRALQLAEPDMRAILGLAGYAGLRAAEIAGLDWRDVNTRHQTLRLHGKGTKDRTVHAPPPLLQLLEALPGRRGPVIPRLDGQPRPNQPSTISHRANDFLHDVAGLEAHTLHDFRHRLATRLLEEGADVRVLQEVLGHANLGSLQVYTLVRASRIREAMDAAARLDTEARREPRTLGIAAEPHDPDDADDVGGPAARGA